MNTIMKAQAVIKHYIYVNLTSKCECFQKSGTFKFRGASNMSIYEEQAAKGVGIVRGLVDDIITVEDRDIFEATRYCYEIHKLAVEPSAAIGLYFPGEM
ncbi:putative ammonia-lyase, Serine racemase [Helianthus annuus]|nr:putative ammonia-lyase, Serine racemase [Helianthus annuus]